MHHLGESNEVQSIRLTLITINHLAELLFTGDWAHGRGPHVQPPTALLGY